MSLLDDLQALAEESSAFPATRCRVAFFYETLADNDRILFEDLVESKKMPATRIAQVMQKHGYDIAAHSVTRHRKRKEGSGCLCP